jgi:hypothetical protein
VIGGRGECDQLPYIGTTYREIYWATCAVKITLAPTSETVSNLRNENAEKMNKSTVSIIETCTMVHINIISCLHNFISAI